MNSETSTEPGAELPSPRWRRSKTALLRQEPRPFPEGFARRRDVVMVLFYVLVYAAFISLRGLVGPHGSVRLPASLEGVIVPAFFLMCVLIILQWVDVCRRPFNNRLGWWFLAVVMWGWPIYYCIMCRRPRGYPLGKGERLSWEIFMAAVVLWAIYALGFVAAVTYFGHRPQVVPG